MLFLPFLLRQELQLCMKIRRTMDARGRGLVGGESWPRAVLDTHSSFELQRHLNETPHAAPLQLGGDSWGTLGKVQKQPWH